MRLALAWLLVGCGRLAFDPIGGGAGSGDGGPIGDGPFSGDSPLANANRVFVTSMAYPLSSIGGVANADALCMQHAAMGGLPSGTYVAYISGPGRNAIDVLAPARGWVRPDGRPVADQPSDFVMDRMLHTIHIDEFGNSIGNNIGIGELVATATLSDGSLAGSGNCGDLSSTTGMIAMGAAYRAGRSWASSGYSVPCTMTSRLFCFGVDRVTPLVVPPQPGRLAFITPWTKGGGITSADLKCDTDAANAGRLGNFRAFMATSTATAATRFSTTGSRWVRVDGIPVADTPEDLLLDNNTRAPINVMLDGTFTTSEAMTGADSPGAPTSGSCMDWTSTSTTLTFLLGDSTASGPAFFAENTRACASISMIYCLEE